jgi:hypothetical protein
VDTGQGLSNISYCDSFCEYSRKTEIFENKYEVLPIYLIEVVDIFFFLYYVAAENFPASLEFVYNHRVQGKNNL